MAETTAVNPMHSFFEAPMDNAFLAVAMEVDGLPDSQGNREAMSLKLKYAENGEEYRKGNFKIIKFWMPKYHAVPLGKMILMACSDGEWVAPLKN